MKQKIKEDGIDYELIDEIIYGDDTYKRYISTKTENVKVESYRLTDLAKTQIGNIKDEKTLFVLADRYNWDDGFELPKEILKNENCTLSIAILIFDRIEGWNYHREKQLSVWNKEYNDFIVELYKNLKAGKYEVGNLLEKMNVTKQNVIENLEDIGAEVCKISEYYAKLENNGNL